MAQNNIKDTTHLLVYGHEGWLEEYPSHYHLGDPIMVKMQWGHNPAVDGLPNKDYLKHHIYAPDGTCAEASAEPSGDLWYDITADTNQEGFHMLVTSYDECWAQYPNEDYKLGTREQYPDAIEVRDYCQYATTCVSVGHHHDTEVTPIKGLEMYLLPVSNPNYVVGHELKLQLMLQDKPADTHKGTLIYQSENGLVETEITSDANGVFTVKPDKVGTYCLIVRHVTNDKKDGIYEGRNFTITHCFKVGEHGHHHHH